jgi:hypothetical protein
MRSRQKLHYEASKRVNEYYTLHENEFNAIAELKEEKIILDKEIEQIEDAAAIQASDISGEAVIKEEKKMQMINTVLRYALRGKVKAIRNGKKGLAEELDHPISYYDLSDTETCASRATATKDAIKNNLNILTNITIENVEEMQKTITEYRSVMVDPQVKKQTKKVKGTDTIEPFINASIETIENIGSLIHSYFPNSEISKEFDAISKVGNDNTRHNHLILFAEDSDTQEPITTAKATNLKTNKTITADQEGQIIFNTVRNGKQHFRIEAPGYTTQEIFINVRRGTTTEQEIDLDKV